ncbi:hypothetical protein FCF10_00305 [Lactobacillus amylovorus subsp. animalium]|uniref:hypothetical protein n=1 Tax=Lactobacillus amylovorus TaxID=1604 RepID=UPI0010ABE3D5|nr:hypothetical protein [Lactobacillus amylovorus]MDB6248849.1 hypothetical protein [Lactobacillus amylovorus]TJY06652.1 hypothetical protein FCF10_00305 [Lactobacillus amylovorus]
MSNHLIEINGKYPWGVSPLGFGFITLSWKLLILTIWLFSSLYGRGNLGLSLLIALLPEIGLMLYEFNRNNKYGWIITPLQNTMKSAKMIKESNPLYRTIFGYNKIDRAPVFYLDSGKNGDFKLTFEPHGCPNANIDILPVLQQELIGYEIIPIGSIQREYIVRKRRNKGEWLTDADFYKN